MKLLSSIGIVLALSVSFAFAGNSTFKVSNMANASGHIAPSDSHRPHYPCLLLRGTIGKFPGRFDKKNSVPSNAGNRILKGNSKKGSIVKKNKKKGGRASTNTEPTIVQSWVNWDVCLHDRTSNKVCSPQDGVPKGYYFLDTFEVSSSCSNIAIPVRKCNVAVDPKGELVTVIIPVAVDFYRSYDNNAKGGICNMPRPNDLLYVKTDVVTNFNYTQLPYAFVNGRSVKMEYIIEDEPFYLKSCANKEQCCDYCDDPACEDCKGVDAYPIIGYVATDTSRWKPGEKRFYQWGYGYEVDACVCSGWCDWCIRCSIGRVELTAVDKNK